MTLAPNNAMGTVFDDEGFDGLVHRKRHGKFDWSKGTPLPGALGPARKAAEHLASLSPERRAQLDREWDGPLAEMPKERRAQLEREWR